MIDRYDDKEISNLFTLENRYNKFLDIELAVIEANVKLGKIPNSDYQLIKEKAKVDVDRINYLETIYKHDVIAFTRSISENLGEEKRWFHYGLTSTDVVDSAMSLIYNEATNKLYPTIDKLLEAYKEKALKYKSLKCVARTHGVHGEITSFGLKFARFYDELKRNKDRLINAQKELCVIKLEGAVGNFLMTDPEVENYVAHKFNLLTPRIATQVIARDVHTNYLNIISLIATHLENVAVEFRNLSRTEINEVNEYFSKDQKGSSAMPHKHNPIGLENISGLARLVRGYSFASYDNICLYHERDISHSSNERIIFLDALTLISYMLKRMTRIINGLVINEDNIIANIYKTKGLLYSEKVLTKLIESGVSREEAYDNVQVCANKVYNSNFTLDFKEELKKNDFIKSHLSNEDIENIFNNTDFLKNVPYIYKRVGLE